MSASAVFILDLKGKVSWGGVGGSTKLVVSLVGDLDGSTKLVVSLVGDLDGSTKLVVSLVGDLDGSTKLAVSLVGDLEGSTPSRSRNNRRINRNTCTLLSGEAVELVPLV